ncbi:hypothetical protein [Rhodopseudomonas palustris]|uniref:hypothetical protein n=1 Tax=Rhodopseudomonas palustris TaxID=1076 RepID=UPI0011C3F1D1|nr:hypothetical protein [Rhodopseudomonas palustris]
MSSSLDLESADNTALPFESLQSIGSVYAFLDVDHPAVQWAVMRGMLVSSSHVSDSEGFVSFMQAGIVAAGNNARLFNEAIIELYRQKNFQKNQSRMRGMYFFGSRAEAEARINDADWPAYFKPENLVEFDLHCDEMPTVVDANWITFAEVDKSGRIPIDSLEWISRYWEGKQYNDRPVWEVIANGVALVLDENIRRACTLKLERQFADFAHSNIDGTYSLGSRQSRWVDPSVPSAAKRKRRLPQLSFERRGVSRPPHHTENERASRYWKARRDDEGK